MEMLVCCLLFAVGVVLVIKGGDAFVDAASWIARAMNIPTFIIGATIVSLATTMPEMIVSVMAAAQGKVDMAVGNAVGSVIANTGLIMAVAMMAMAIPCSREKYLRQCLLLTAVAAVLVLGCRGGKLGIGWSAVLIVLFLLFMGMKVLPRKIRVSKTNFTVGATAVSGSARTEFSGGGKKKGRLSITSPKYTANPLAKCGMVLELEAVDNRWTRPADRKAKVTAVSAVTV